MIVPKLLLDLALFLLAITPPTPLSEAVYRAAIGRAYYYLYHETIEYLRTRHPEMFARELKRFLSDRGWRFDPGMIDSMDRASLEGLKVGLHGFIPKLLRKMGRRDEARRFKRFKNFRNVADYRLGRSLGRRHTVRQVRGMRALAGLIRSG